MLKRFFSSTLVGNSGIYLLGNVVSSGLSFLLLPILTRHLTPEDYGILTLWQVTVNILYPFIGMGIHGAISVKYFDRENTDVPEYIGNCFYVLMVTSGLFFLIVTGFRMQISEFSSIPAGWMPYLVVVCISQSVTAVAMALFFVQRKAFQYASYQIVQGALGLFLSIFFVVVLNKKWEGRIEAQILVAVFFIAIYGVFVLYRNGWIKFSYNSNYIKHIFRYCVPLVPHELGGQVMASSDKIILKDISGIYDTGVYNVACQISGIFNMVTSSFNIAYIPWLYERLKRNDIKVKLSIVRYTYLYFIVIFLLSIIYSIIASSLLPFLVGMDFRGAGEYIMWLSIGQAFAGMYLMVVNYLSFAEKTHFLAVVTFLIAVAGIGINYFFIKMNGAIGAAQASCVIYLLLFLLTWIVSAKSFEMPWNLLSMRYKTR